ncbi:MAG TPA: type II toxin-antitoxin system VapC family toxin [Bryobacteraceae bacterium]|nr:type II toxin-antitoxin system VapC family toxin [Bryobacteraceae bacterium]
MKAYLDSSVAVRSLLHEPGAIEDWSQWDLVVTSALLRVETLRAIDRMRVMGALAGASLADTTEALQLLMICIHEVGIGPAVLNRAAASFPTVLSALDAIHVATALLWMEEQGEPLLFVTHDVQQAIAARTCGLEVQTAP